MNLLSFDLNLLKVLKALLDKGSTTEAARAVGLSQPAVSAALGRLRHSIGDPLFVRQGQRLVPTDFALGLTEPLAVLLTDLESVLTARDGFDPATESASFTVSGSDFFAELMMPELARRLPGRGVTLQLIELDPVNYLAPVRSEQADLALVPAFALEEWVEHEEVFSSDFAVIARRRHPATNGLAEGAPFPLDLFCALPHIIFSVEGKRNTMSDTALARFGRERHVAMTVADFSGVYRSVAASDMISVIPAALAVSVAESAGLSVFGPPMPIGPVPIHMAWHRRSSKSPAHRWLRVTLADILRQLPERFSLKSPGVAEIPKAN